jgi:hypothetical protein
LSLEAEVDLSGSAKLRLNFRVPVSSLKACEPKVIPDWKWKRVKNEKFIVHLDFDGNIRQWKVGQP